jgi:hypothetical protein
VSGADFREASGITSGPDGSLYVVNANLIDENIIRRITMDGKVSVFAKGFKGKSISNPPTETMATYCRGLVVDSSGNVFVAATGSRSVLKITSMGNISTVLETDDPWSPTAVALFHGDLYVLEWKDTPAFQSEVRKAWVPRVRKLSADGKVTILATITR